MNILIFEYTHRHLGEIMQYERRHIQQIKNVLPEAQVDIINPLREPLGDYLRKAEVLIISPLDHSELLDFQKIKAPHLKWVHITAAGATTFAEKLRGTDIRLTNSSGVHPIPIAEHVFTFMLMLARQFTVSYRAQIEQVTWNQEKIAKRVSELNGATLGIVGFGRIGQKIAQIAQGFQMNVVALTHSHPDMQHPAVNEFYSSDRLGVLLQKSDFVVNCLPLTNETVNFFNKERLGQMRQSACFVNIGRGKTVDEDALIEALEQGRIAGAGLDVFAEEPLPSESPLWRLENVIITPHYAGWTPRYIDRVIDIFGENLRAFIAYKPMPTEVDKSKGY